MNDLCDKSPSNRTSPFAKVVVIVLAGVAALGVGIKVFFIGLIGHGLGGASQADATAVGMIYALVGGSLAATVVLVIARLFGVKWRE